MPRATNGQDIISLLVTTSRVYCGVSYTGYLVKASTAMAIDESDIFKCFEMQNVYKTWRFVTLYLCAKMTPEIQR